MFINKELILKRYATAGAVPVQPLGKTNKLGDPNRSMMAISKWRTSLAARRMVASCDRSPHSARKVSVSACRKILGRQAVSRWNSDADAADDGRAPASPASTSPASSADSFSISSSLRFRSDCTSCRARNNPGKYWRHCKWVYRINSDGHTKPRALVPSSQ